MILTPAQATIAKDRHRFRVVNCGRRFGKTVLACEEMGGVAIAKKDRRVSYYAPTRDDARDIMWAMVVKRYESITTYKNDSRLELKVKTQDGGESMIVLYGWEAVQERGKGRGLSNDLIVMDEVSSMRNFWMGWDEVLSPTLVDRAGSALFISTPKGFNHFYDLYNLEGKNEDYKSFHFTSYDNPNIPRKEIEREQATKTEDRFAQEYLADFRKTEGLVYKEFSRERHLFDTSSEPQGIEYLAGIDFGFTNPAAVIHIKRDSDDNYWITEEWYKTGRTERQIAEYVASCKFNRVYPDPESPSAIEELNNKGVSVVEVVKGKDSVQSGINKVRELFKQNRLHIHSSCVNLISELETYSYEDKKDERNEQEKPIKHNDHALDALRYAITMNSQESQITKDEQAERVMIRQRALTNQSR